MISLPHKLAGTESCQPLASRVTDRGQVRSSRFQSHFKKKFGELKKAAGMARLPIPILSKRPSGWRVSGKLLQLHQVTCVLIAILSPYNYYEKLNYYHSNYYYYHYHHWIITALPGDVCPDRYFITKQLLCIYIYMIILFLSWQFLIG